MNTVDYYFAPISPWTYLGHARFVRIARETGAQVNVMPIDLGAIFPVSGGLPLPKRAPQRQAYRLLELKRFGDHLGVKINVQPETLSGPGRRRSEARSSPPTRRSAQLPRWSWSAESAPRPGPKSATSATSACCAPSSRRRASMPALVERAATPAIAERYAACTRQAIDAGVFGAPSYVIDGELFWGQDRLDFVERRLRADEVIARRVSASDFIGDTSC